MASFHSNTSTVSRGSGGSSCAKGAYISGSCITDERTGEVHDYTKKQGIEHTEILLPNNIQDKVLAQTEEDKLKHKEEIKELKDSLTPSQLWNKAEQAENRKDARVAREWVIALPHELNLEQRKELAKELGQDITDRYQVATQISIHEPSKHGDDRNYHVHILSTTRKIDNNLNLTVKADIELSNKKCLSLGIKTTDEQIKSVREIISTKINQHLEKAQINERVTHLSYKTQGLDRVPTKHMGKSATQLERKGIQTEIGDYNRSAILFNELKNTLETIYNHKPQHTLTNMLEPSKNQYKIELTATEQAKIYLQKRAEDRIKPSTAKESPQKPITDDRKNQLLKEILSKRSYQQIIDGRKEALQPENQKQTKQENKLEQQKPQEKIHQNAKVKDRVLER